MYALSENHTPKKTKLWKNGILLFTRLCKNDTSLFFFLFFLNLFLFLQLFLRHLNATTNMGLMELGRSSETRLRQTKEKRFDDVATSWSAFQAREATDRPTHLDDGGR